MARLPRDWQAAQIMLKQDDMADHTTEDSVRTAGPPALSRGVIVWLSVLYLMVLSMVVVGGVTRLTGSGLSMVEWRPIMGTLPPMSQGEWVRVFDKYRASPQYRQVNQRMTLREFRRIFWWEYGHRLGGRLIGVVFFVPWLLFVATGRLPGVWLRRSAIALLLGGLQGVLGWLMVKSGLVDVPAVSHYRLAAHLSLALLVANWLLWMVLEGRGRRVGDASPDEGSLVPGRWSWGLVSLLALQTVYGALMAGTRAGHMYGTFPDMNGEYLPQGLLATAPVWRDLLENPTTIHFVHRSLGWLIAGVGLVLWVRRWRRPLRRPQRMVVDLVCGLLAAQFLLGVLTVLHGVALGPAVAHQITGALLLSAAVWMAHAGGHGGPPAQR